jgi:drug/metabolite transporter (DMT)-like permease
MASALLVSALVVTPVVLLSSQPLGDVHGEAWVWLALFVLFPGALGHLLVNWAHRFVDVTISSVIVVGLPVVAALLAWVILHETLGPLELLGGLAVIVCVAAIAARPTLSGAAEDLPL